MFMIAVSISLQGCTSRGPSTRYFTLLPQNYTAEEIASSQLSQQNYSFGIGPIKLPEYADRPAIVSYTDGNQLVVSGYSAWAGDLKGNISRVMASNFALLWGTAEVTAFPWDNRVRPDYQLRINFEEFAGDLQGIIKLKAKWTLLNQQGNAVILKGYETLEGEPGSTKLNNYNEYVGVLNSLINQLSAHIAFDVHDKLNKF